MFKPYIRLLNAGIIRSGVSIIGLLISIFWLHPVWATDGSATPSSYQVYLPVVSSPFTPMIRKMAASLPVDDSCKNCWTRNGLLSLPPEELARIEQKEEEIQVYANELVAKDQFVANLIKSGQINPSDWPTPAQLTSVPPAEAQKMVAGLNAQLAQMVTAAGVAKQTTPYWAANFVNIAELREPNDKLYNNSCGPASIKVALSVRMPVSQIPWIAPIGTWVDKNPDGTQGDWTNGLEQEDIPRIADYLNRTLGTLYYWYSGSSWATDPAVEFRAKITNTVDYNLALIFGVRTGNLKDWDHDAPHIITAYGYSWDTVTNSTRIYWAETASISAGHYQLVNGVQVAASYYYSMAARPLWDNAAKINDFQIYH